MSYITHMKKTLLLLMLFMVIGCDTNQDGILNVLDEGPVCSTMKSFCEDEGGDYFYNDTVDTDTELLCSCTWD